MQGDVRNDLRDDLQPLVLDFLEWIAREPRTYGDVMEAWRTSCPRLTVWENTIDRGLAAREHRPGCGTFIVPTQAGWDLLTLRGYGHRGQKDCESRQGVQE